MNVRELRASLKSVLSELLGVYENVSTSQKRPAIVVGADIPSNHRVYGLECVILPTPTPRVEREFSQSPPYKDFGYTIQFRNWQDEAGKTFRLTPAIDAILRNYRNARVNSVVPATSAGNVETATMTITFTTPL